MNISEDVSAHDKVIDFDNPNNTFSITKDDWSSDSWTLND